MKGEGTGQAAGYLLKPISASSMLQVIRNYVFLLVSSACPGNVDIIDKRLCVTDACPGKWVDGQELVSY